MDIKTIRIAEWNANGLLHHELELIQFLQDNKNWCTTRIRNTLYYWKSAQNTQVLNLPL